MIHGATLAGLGACVFALLLGISPILEEWELRAGLVAASLGGFIWLYWLDSRREVREKKEAEAANEVRFNELARSAAGPHFSLAVKGSSFFSISLAAVILGGLLLAMSASMEKGAIAVAIGGVFLLALGIPAMMLRGIPGIGQPILVLSTGGFAAPQIPLMPWSLVDGIAIQEMRQKGELVAHVLSFRIDSLPQHIHRTGLLYRLLYKLRWGAGRKAIGLPLRKTDEHPEVVYRIARLLWTKATGRDNDWDPMLTEEGNLALRRSAALLAKMRDKRFVSETLERDPDEPVRMLEEIRKDREIVVQGYRRQANILVAVGIGMILLLVLYAVLRLFWP